MRVTYETEQGWRLYKGITDVVILTECHRFEEPILEYVKIPKTDDSAKLTEQISLHLYYK
jgi:hypothetical protein